MRIITCVCNRLRVLSVRESTQIVFRERFWAPQQRHLTGTNRQRHILGARMAHVAKWQRKCASEATPRRSRGSVIAIRATEQVCAVTGTVTGGKLSFRAEASLK